MTIEIVEHPDREIARLAQPLIEVAEASGGSYGERSPAWLDVLRDGLGQRPLVALSRDRGGYVDGYLPLSLVRSRFFGSFLVSLPYVTHAGAVASDAAVGDRLRETALDLAVRLDVDHLELRESQPSGDDRFAVTRTDKVRMTRKLPVDADELWRDLDAKARNQIGKGERSVLTLHFGGLELLDALYSLLAERMRDLGSPVHPRRLFAAMLAMPDRSAEIALVERRGRVAAAALLFHGVHGAGGAPATSVPIAASRRSERASNANMWMYHRLMVRAVERGSYEIDFGRTSAGSGAYRFKSQWGCVEAPTCWQYHVRRGDPGSVRFDDPRHARRIAVWKRLPLWVSRALGPRISRGIP